VSPELQGSDDVQSLHDYMAAANAAYYGSRDPLGAAGDFITAPEISQMFGELIGLWVADLTLRAGAPDFAYVELGPGRGTLAADALRAMARAQIATPVHFVETSPVLKARQREVVPQAHWHDMIDSLPGDRPLIIIANEFFDALPIRQYERTGRGWRERMVGQARFTLGDADRADEIPVQLADAPSVRSWSAARSARRSWQHWPIGLDSRAGHCWSWIMAMRVRQPAIRCRP
jgi:NADH dehydrogenase [ubiquinone] 1 alpha subcomplex assembly factor 7